MAIALEAFAVVVRNEAIMQRYPGGTEAFEANIPNRRFCADQSLSVCSFMVEKDAVAFFNELGSLGLCTEDGSDAVICDAFHDEVRPECDWLLTGPYRKALIGRLNGDETKVIVGPPGWNPEEPPPLNFNTAEEAAKRLKFLRRDGNVEVFWDSEEGKEVYVGRTQVPPDLLFKQAAKIVVANLRVAGTPPAPEEATVELQRAVEMLEIVVEQAPDAWRVHWMLGKAWHALDKTELAHGELSRAFELEKEEVVIPKELCGICLELGRGDEAVRAAEHAVGLDPRDHQLVANLAVAYLIAGKIKEAEATIQAALAQNAEDRINQNVQRLITKVAKGERAQPKSLREMMGR